MTPPDTVAQVLAATGTILLDFEDQSAPCFATTPDHTAAAKLRHVLAAHHVDIPPNASPAPKVGHRIWRRQVA